MSDIVSYELSDNTAIIYMNDGKANAVSHDLIEGLWQALDHAKDDEVKAIVLIGREGIFSAGFDLNEIQHGIAEAKALVRAGANLALRLFRLEVPLVYGVTGHAIAMGAVLTMIADEAIGASGDFKLGLNETAIGLALPEFATTLAKERLAKPYLYRATALAELFDPKEAVQAGFLTNVVAPELVAGAAIARAKQLAATLNADAVAVTKKRIRKDCLKMLKKSANKDLEL